MKKYIKCSNIIFLLIVVFHTEALIFLSILSKRFNIGFVTNALVSELTVLLPGLIMLLVMRSRLDEWFVFGRVKVSVVLLTILFTYLVMPFISFINVLSQLFTDNAALDIFGSASSLSPGLMVFIIGVIGPICEELVFRGMIYQGYRKSGRIIGAIVLSSLLFGLMHMNVNQCCYAVVMGIMLALLFEATGSLIAPIIMHMTVNTHNTVLALSASRLYEKMGISDDITELASEVSTKESILYIAGGLLVISSICLVFAFLVFTRICRKMGTVEHMLSIFNRGDGAAENVAEVTDDKLTFLGPSLIIGIVICLVLTFVEVPF